MSVSELLLILLWSPLLSANSPLLRTKYMVLLDPVGCCLLRPMTWWGAGEGVLVRAISIAAMLAGWRGLTRRA